MVSGTQCSSGLSSGKVKTLQGETVEIKVSDSKSNDLFSITLTQTRRSLTAYPIVGRNDYFVVGNL